jgi:inositol transport system permease protein
VIGGTSLFGGVGTIFGTVIGTILIGVLLNGLVMLKRGGYPILLNLSMSLE